MELQVVEAVVRRLFSDPEFRARAVASPEATLAEYELGADERVAVTKLCGQLADGEGIGATPQSAWF